MEGLLYFAFGALNIGLLYLFTYLYKRETEFDIFPGRRYGDKMEMITSIVGYFFGGPFGTALLIILGIFLYIMWYEYYRNKK